MTKNALLADLHSEQEQWEALLAQIGEARMDQPGAAGEWSIKDIVAHITGWRRRTVARLQAALRGDADPPPPWPAQLQTDDEINAWLYQTNRDRSVQEVLGDSRQVFDQLVAAIEAFPEAELLDPHRFPWWDGMQLTGAAFFAHFHEEHEPDMRAWLVRQERSAMDEASMTHYITDTFAGVETTTAFGYTFFFYSDERKLPFATLAASDNEYDRVSNLDRSGVFRLNIGVSKQTFQSLFGADKVDVSSYDFTALDTIMPHPDYAPQSFVCVLNPGDATLEQVRSLLAEAYDLAVKRHTRRQASQ